MAGRVCFAILSLLPVSPHCPTCCDSDAEVLPALQQLYCPLAGQPPPSLLRLVVVLSSVCLCGSIELGSPVPLDPVRAFLQAFLDAGGFSPTGLLSAPLLPLPFAADFVFRLSCSFPGLFAAYLTQAMEVASSLLRCPRHSGPALPAELVLSSHFQAWFRVLQSGPTQRVPELRWFSGELGSTLPFLIQLSAWGAEESGLKTSATALVSSLLGWGSSGSPTEGGIFAKNLQVNPQHHPQRKEGRQNGSVAERRVFTNAELSLLRTH